MSAADGKLEVRTALRAWQAIVERGTRDGHRHQLGGMTAESSFDGYTIQLTDGVVTATLLFHSRVAIDAPSARALDRFLKRVERLTGLAQGSEG